MFNRSLRTDEQLSWFRDRTVASLEQGLMIRAMIMAMTSLWFFLWGEEDIILSSPICLRVDNTALTLA